MQAARDDRRVALSELEGVLRACRSRSPYLRLKYMARAVGVPGYSRRGQSVASLSSDIARTLTRRCGGPAVAASDVYAIAHSTGSGLAQGAGGRTGRRATSAARTLHVASSAESPRAKGDQDGPRDIEALCAGGERVGDWFRLVNAARRRDVYPPAGHLWTRRNICMALHTQGGAPGPDGLDLEWQSKETPRGRQPLTLKDWDEIIAAYTRHLLADPKAKVAAPDTPAGRVWGRESVLMMYAPPQAVENMLVRDEPMLTIHAIGAGTYLPTKGKTHEKIVYREGKLVETDMDERRAEYMKGRIDTEKMILPGMLPADWGRTRYWALEAPVSVFLSHPSNVRMFEEGEIDYNEDYGRFVLILDESTKKRATFTLGDSMNLLLEDYGYYESMEPFGTYSFTFEAVPDVMMSEFGPWQSAYYEAQIWGGIQPEYVRELWVPEDMTADERSVIQRVRRARPDVAVFFYDVLKTSYSSIRTRARGYET